MEMPLHYCKVLGICGHLNPAITQVDALVVKKNYPLLRDNLKTTRVSRTGSSVPAFWTFEILRPPQSQDWFR